MYEIYIIALIAIFGFIVSSILLTHYSATWITCINEKKFFMVLCAIILIVSGQLGNELDKRRFIQTIGWLLLLFVAVPFGVTQNSKTQQEKVNYDIDRLWAAVPGSVVAGLTVWYLYLRTVQVGDAVNQFEKLRLGISVSYIVAWLIFGLLLGFQEGVFNWSVLALTIPGSVLVIAGSALLWYKRDSLGPLYIALGSSLLTVGWLFITSGISQNIIM